jgi:hypothetical protein
VDTRDDDVEKSEREPETRRRILEQMTISLAEYPGTRLRIVHFRPAARRATNVKTP